MSLTKHNELPHRLSAMSCYAIALLSGVLILRGVCDILLQLSGRTVANPRILSDLNFILCGGWHMEAPYKSCPGPDAVTGFIYPPPAAFYAHWVGLWGLQTGFMIQTVISVAILIPTMVVMHILAPSESRTEQLAIILATLAIAPVSMSFVTGHLNFIMLASFVLPVWLMRNHRAGWAGRWLAAGFWLKLYSIMLLALFVAERRSWRAAGASVAALFLIPILLLPWVPLHLYRDFFTDRMPPLQRITAPGIAQSIAPVILYVQQSATTLTINFKGSVLTPGMQMLIRAILLCAIAMAVLHQRALRGKAPLEPVALLLGGILLYAPLAWGYHYVLAMPLVWLGLTRLLRGDCGRIRSALILYAWAALLIPSWTSVPGPLRHSALLYLPFITRYPVALFILMGIVVDSRRADWAALWHDVRRDGLKTLLYEWSAPQAQSAP